MDAKRTPWFVSKFHIVSLAHFGPPISSNRAMDFRFYGSWLKSCQPMSQRMPVQRLPALDCLISGYSKFLQGLDFLLIIMQSWLGSRAWGRRPRVYSFCGMFWRSHSIVTENYCKGGERNQSIVLPRTMVLWHLYTVCIYIYIHTITQESQEMEYDIFGNRIPMLKWCRVNSNVLWTLYKYIDYWCNGIGWT